MKYVIILDIDKEEKGIMINALNELRNNLLKKEIDPYPVDELLLKLLDAPEKKKMFKNKYIEAR